MAATRSTTLATTVRVIDRVHCNAAVMRTLANPAAAASLAECLIFVVEIADLSNRGVAFNLHLANFSAWELEEAEFSFFRNHLGLCARASGHLGTFTWTQFNVMNYGAGWDVLEGKRISDQDVRCGATRYRRTTFKPTGATM